MHLAGIDTNLLTTLDALLREQSVNRAARRIGLSPSATSHALGRLRAVLEDPLLVRAGRKMVLTPRAERLAPRVHEVVRDMARIFAPEPGLRPAVLEREFRFAVEAAYAPFVEHRLGGAVAEQAPGVRLSGYPCVEEPTAALRLGTLDLAIGVFDGLPDDIELATLLVDPVVCLGRRGHPWLDRVPDLKAFVEATQVVTDPRSRADRALDRALADLDVRRRRLQTVSRRSAIPFAVAGSDAVAAVSRCFADSFAPLLDLLPLPMPVDVPAHRLQIAWHRRNEADQGHAWFRAQIIDLFDRAIARPSADAA